MSVKIRLSKVGKKHQISFRIIATDSRTKRDGAFLEILGFYNPHDKHLKIDKDRIAYWIGKGAKPTEAVTKLLKDTTDQASNQKLEVGSGKLERDVGSEKKKSHLSSQ